MTDDWDDIPIGNPARGALRHAGLAHYEDLTSLTRKQIADLHGIGPKAVRILDAELSSRGLAFRPG
jgi:predicted flap endonuclease-1-like 5' DNA nuclease